MSDIAVAALLAGAILLASMVSVEIVLPAHGDPVLENGRGALAEALAA